MGGAAVGDGPVREIPIRRTLLACSGQTALKAQACVIQITAELEADVSADFQCSRINSCSSKLKS